MECTWKLALEIAAGTAGASDYNIAVASLTDTKTNLSKSV